MDIMTIINEPVMETDSEMDLAYESVFDYACEASSEGHVIDPKVRDALPDKAFGIVYKDDEGKTQRKYPLVVKNDIETTKKLVAKAIQFFHYCRPDWKKDLATKIASVVKSEKLDVSIATNSVILKFVTQAAFGPTAKFTEPVKKAKK